MSVNLLVSRPAIVTLQGLKNASKCFYATKVKGIVEELNAEETPTYDSEIKYTDEEIIEMRNKSRLWPQHYRILHGQKPYDESKEFYHDSVWYKKRLLGKYGIDAAGVPAGICWPSQEEIESKKEYEALAYPSDIKQMWKDIDNKNKEAAEAILKRDADIDKVVANFDKWRAAIQAKITKKEEQLRAAKEKKENMMREIKEYFGYNIDSRDERFQEMLALKEKEDKKKKKEERKRLNNEKQMIYLTQQAQNSESNAVNTKSSESQNKGE